MFGRLQASLVMRLRNRSVLGEEGRASERMSGGMPGRVSRGVLMAMDTSPTIKSRLDFPDSRARRTRLLEGSMSGKQSFFRKVSMYRLEAV